MLHNSTLWDSTAFLCILLVESHLHHGQFSSCSYLPHTSFLQGLEGFPTGSALPGPGVRDSLVQQCVCGSFTTWWDKEWVSLPKQGRRSVWFVSWGTIAPLGCRFLFQPTWGAVSSCWQPAYLTSGTLFLSDVIPLVPLTVLYVPMSTSRFTSLATGSLW